MNDEKTTEIEIPQPLSNIVRVNFTERRKVPRTPGSPAPVFPPANAQAPMVQFDAEWSTPLWIRVAALLAILALSFFVL